jgi:hypothetical protein
MDLGRYQMPMKFLIAFAVAIELPTGLILILAPAIFMRLIFGHEGSGSDQVLGPLAGVALLALAVACWPTHRVASPAKNTVMALLLFSALCAVYLAYNGIVGARIGLLLWPAASGHALIAVMLAWRWLVPREA